MVDKTKKTHKTVMIGVKVSADLMKKLKRMAAEKGMGAGTMVRSWIYEFMGEAKE